MSTVHTVFVSYSRKDSARVQQAVELLEAGGAEVFRDIDDIQFGDRWEDVIKAKLAEAERVLIFWSQHALRSEWVGREWSIALAMDKRLVPVLLDDTPMPPELSQFHALTNFAGQPGSNGRRTGLLVGGGGLLLAGAVLILLPTFRQPSMPQPPSVQPPVISQQPVPDLPESRSDSAHTYNPSQPPVDDTDSLGSREQPWPVSPVHPPKATAPQAPQQQDHGMAIAGWLAGGLLLTLLATWWLRQRGQQKRAAGEQLVQMVFEEN